MSINLGPSSIEELRPRITVIGVGGAGGNAIANMIEAKIEGVDFVVANTDAQALNNSVAEQRIQLGPDITQGLGAGSRPEVGRAAAEETLAEIDRILEGTHMVFIAAGMGGGTGTGAAPIIAKAARDKGVLTVGVVTKPFLFEGTRRMRAADAGIEELQQHVDTLIVIPNQNLFLIAKAETTFKEAFQLADEVLQQGVRSITDLMVMPGLINLDFADVRSVMGEMGKAMMGTGEGEGENRALAAAEKAIANPLLDGVSMQGAKGVIISIIGGEDMKLLEVDEAANHIRELVDPDANIIWGSAFNPGLNGKIRVSVVATGIEQSSQQAEVASRPLSLTRSRGPVLPMASAPASNDEAPPQAAAAPPPLVFDRDEAPAAQAEPEPMQDDRSEDEAEPFDLEDGQIVDEFDDGEALGGPEVTPGPQADDGRESAYASLTGLVRTQREAPLELDEAEAEAAPPAAQQDELLLDADRRASEDGDGSSGTQAGSDSEDEDDAQRLPSTGGSGAGDRAAAATGSTLFERMANLSRTKPTSEEEEETPSSISIPRFLGRQNNQ
jgi:cell division protein FtsZ